MPNVFGTPNVVFFRLYETNSSARLAAVPHGIRVPTPPLIVKPAPLVDVHPLGLWLMMFTSAPTVKYLLSLYDVACPMPNIRFTPGSNVMKVPPPLANEPEKRPSNDMLPVDGKPIRMSPNGAVSPNELWPPLGLTYPTPMSTPNS